MTEKPLTSSDQPIQSSRILLGDIKHMTEQARASVATTVNAACGCGFSDKSLRHMVRFAEAFSDKKIVSTLMRQLSWSYFLAIIYLPDPLQREFYAEMCRIERWSVRIRRQKSTKKKRPKAQK